MNLIKEIQCILSKFKFGEKIQEFLKSKNKEFEITRKLVDKDFTVKLGGFLLLLIILVMNLMVEYITKLPSFIFGGDRPKIYMMLNFGYIFEFFPIYIIIITLFLILYIKFILDIKKSFNEIEDGQKGTARFATREEIEQEYRSVPLKDKDFEGKGGVPIARGYYKFKDKNGNEQKEEVMYIDDSSVNNLIIGTTRSGKGETFVVPSIDIYSRASEKPSMVINDPKGELIAMSKKTLEERGYEVLLLNLTEPMNSMSYNPLELIIDAFKRKDYGDAQLLCKTLTFTIYNDPSAKDKIWQKSAMSLTNALILSLCEKYIPLNQEYKITMYTVVTMLMELGQVYVDSNGVERYPLDEYFQKLPITSKAKMQYVTTKFAKETTKSGILTSTAIELDIFTYEKLSRMTSKNSLDFKTLGFEKNKNKPKAIFMVTPDYDKSNHILTSIFIRQAYFVLAKNATMSRNGKCDREIIFLLDEFGNMPPIEGLDNIITVCLGRGIKFNLIIQSYNQLKTLYGESAPTIEGNCGNQIYLLTNDDETSEKFSRLIGEKTITTFSRSGELFSLGKNHTENLDKRRLLTSDELRKLKEGETVVVRTIKRSDKYGNKIVPNPIFNEGEHRMKYRYEYLYETFDNSNSFNDIEVETLHKDLDLEPLNFNSEEEVLNKQQELEKKSIEIQEKAINEDVKNNTNIINNDILSKEKKEDLVAILNNMNLIDSEEEEIILNSISVDEMCSKIEDEEIHKEIKSFFK